ncbi:MAG: hypothetical protein WKF67_01020 [Rubrobacteraceae bacterium]
MAETKARESPGLGNRSTFASRRAKLYDNHDGFHTVDSPVG